MLVCAKGMLTKIKKKHLILGLKHECCFTLGIKLTFLKQIFSIIDFSQSTRLT